MESPVRKVITASAGTGKTYRLSLEFINLLLQYRKDNIGFDEILVITFTRKATAEIRSSIFSHLDNLLQGNKEGMILQQNLKTLFGTVLEKSDLQYLRTAYEKMLTNKQRLQISTIDSFVHGVFKAVIAPYIGITDFRIDNEINTHYLPDVYNHIFSDNNDSEAFMRIFRTAGKNTIEQYDRLILSLLDNRWLLQLVLEQRKESEAGQENSGNGERDHQQNAEEEYLKIFQEEISGICSELRDYFTHQGTIELPVGKGFLSEFAKIIPGDDCGAFLDNLEHLITNDLFLKKYWKEFAGKTRFWKKTAIKNKALQESLEESALRTQNSFCLYIFCRYLLREEEEILLLAEHILGEYDRLKMRDKIFTYADITYYTFRYLYDPALSLIDPVNDSVSNRFYEYLSARTRFMLIDEFQDTGIIQHKLLYPIISEIISGSGSKEYGGVIVVGDEKQSIYGWRNGERDLLLNMPFILQTEDSISLNKTYRSTKFIIDFINELFSAVSEELKTSDLDWKYTGDISSNSLSEEGFLGFYFLNTSTKTGNNDEDEVSSPYQIFVDTAVKPLYEEKKIDPSKSVILARDNKQLRGIAEMLEENGIEYFLESSFSFLEHQSIKPAVHLLRYIAEHDIIHLLRFLRSDICLLPADILKEVAVLYHSSYQEEDGINSFLSSLKERYGDYPVLKKTVKLLEQSNNIAPVELVSLIIKEFNITGLFPEEHNIKNLHFFLEAVSLFQNQNRSDYPKNVSGLLRFLADNEKNEDFRQANIDKIDSLQLMSIHKAKGLEFENVFFFYNVSGRGGQDHGQIIYLYRFNDSFTEPEEFRMSYNYSALLKYMQHPLQKAQERKDILEEMNNIYVALTRAKSNIFLFMTYQNKDGLLAGAEPSKDEQGKLNIKKLFLKSIINYLKIEQPEMRENSELADKLFVKEIGQIPPLSDMSTGIKKTELKKIGNLINLQRSEILEQPEDRDNLYLNFMKVYQQSLYGELVHYYLSFVKYGEENELLYALKRTMTKYGNLVPEKVIRDIAGKVNTFILKNKNLFSRKWDKVFTEYVVFNSSGKEFRIDRLLIDEDSADILIVDYKTGLIKRKDQLDIYERIIQNLSFVRENNYSIQTEYVEIEL